MRALLTAVLGRKVIRYLVCGVVTAGFNLGLLVLVIEGLRIETSFGRSVANLICTEISVIFSFFVYKIFVWRDTGWEPGTLLAASSRSNGSVATSFVVRTLIAFPALDALGVHYTINLLGGIAISAVVNFIISDQFVFRSGQPVAVGEQRDEGSRPGAML